MKVVLVVPNFRWSDDDANAQWHYLPYNLCLLAATIKDIAEVSIIDAYHEDLSCQEFSSRLRNLAPDVVGITVMFDQYLEAGRIGAVLAADEADYVIMGGVAVTMNIETVVQWPSVDYAVRGEGEEVFRRLLLCLMESSESLPLEGFPPGVCWRASISDSAPKVDALDSLPLPAYDLIDFSSYANSAPRKSVDGPRAYPYARIITSRGCPQHCSFCQVGSISGQHFRPRSVQKIIAEIRWLKEVYNIKSLIFDDDNLLCDKKRAQELFNTMIEQKLALPWVAIATAVFKLDKPMLIAMRDSGCEYIDIAVESGSRRVRNEIIGKPLNMAQVAWAVKTAQDLDIFVTANFILGFPGETWSEILETLEVARTLGADYNKYFALIPLPGTRLWDICQEQDCLIAGEGPIWARGTIKTDEFDWEVITYLRALEWDIVNFSDPVKRKKIADMMDVSIERLDEIRQQTRHNVVASLKRKAG